MKIQYNFKQHIIFPEDTIQSALNKMNHHGLKTLFVVSENGRLEGVFTDGDFRRWLVIPGNGDLNLLISEIMNKNFEALNFGIE